MPGGVEAKLSVALDVDVTAAAGPVIAAVNDSMSPLATVVTVFAASVTVVPVLEDTLPTAGPVVTSYADMPAAIPDGVETKLGVALDVKVAAAAVADGVAVTLIAPE